MQFARDLEIPVCLYGVYKHVLHVSVLYRWLVDQTKGIQRRTAQSMQAE